MSSRQKILLVHKGALGDFLQIWPSLYSLTRFWPDRHFYWAGRRDYEIWTRPLGIDSSPWRIVQAADRLYAVDSWPQELQDWQLIWFGLQQPPTRLEFSRLWFLSGLCANQKISARENYLNQLQQKGIALQQDWFQAWQKFFAASGKKNKKIHILPGAGHPAKCWPVHNYLELANRLQSLNMQPEFILGPVEIEKGLQVQEFESVQPANLAELQAVLNSSSLILGNDSGPLHLAAYLARPTLVLFGPSCPKTWAPYQAKILQKEMDCSPCSLVAKIDCQDAACMRLLSVDLVYKHVSQMLRKA